MIWDRVAQWAGPDKTVAFASVAAALSLPASAYPALAAAFRAHGWTLTPPTDASAPRDPLADRGMVAAGRPLYDRWTHSDDPIGRSAAPAKSPAFSLRAVLPMIRQIAASHTHATFSLEDALQEGILAALEAAPRFDPHRNIPLARFLRPRVQGAIRRAAQEQTRIIGLPHGRLEVISRVEQARWDLVADLGHEPSLAEIARSLDLPEAVVHQHLEWARDAGSLDQSAFPDEPDTVGDHVADPRAYAWQDRVLVQTWPESGRLRAASATLEESWQPVEDATSEDAAAVPDAAEDSRTAASPRSRRSPAWEGGRFA